MKKNEINKIKQMITNEIQDDGKITKYGAMLIIYLALSMYKGLLNNSANNTKK